MSLRNVLMPKALNRRVTLSGQSNALGVGRVDQLTGSDATLAAAAFDRVFIWNPATAAYEKLQIGVNNQSASDPAYCAGGAVAHPEFGACFGAELGLALRWTRETAGGNLYIDKNTADGQAISVFRLGQPVFTAAVSRRAAADAWLAARRIRVVDMGWLWVQGEANAGNSQAAYQAELASYFAERASALFEPNASFKILAQIGAISGGYGAGVAAAKAAMAAASPLNTRIVNYANAYNPDGVHLSAVGQLQLGYDWFSILFSKQHLAA